MSIGRGIIFDFAMSHQMVDFRYLLLGSIGICRGGRLRAGGAAARRVAFLRKKLRKNLFGKRFFCGQWGKCEHRASIPEGARPVFADGKDRQRFAFLWVCPFIFFGDDV